MVTEIVTAAIRVMAVIAALYGFRELAVVASLMVQDDAPFYLAQLGVSLFMFLTSLLLWLFAQPMAVAITRFRHTGNREPAWAFTAHELEVALLLVMGLYLLFGVVSDMAYWLSMAFIYQREPLMELPFDNRDVSSLFATLVELLFAIVLTLRAEGIVSLLRRLRS